MVPPTSASRGPDRVRPGVGGPPRESVRERVKEHVEKERAMALGSLHCVRQARVNRHEVCHAIVVVTGGASSCARSRPAASPGCSSWASARPGAQGRRRGGRRRSRPSSPNPTRSTGANNSTSSPPCSRANPARSRPCCATRERSSWRPPRPHRCPGRRSRRSPRTAQRGNQADGPTSSGSSSTPKPCSAWAAPSWSELHDERQTGDRRYLPRRLHGRLSSLTNTTAVARGELTPAQSLPQRPTLTIYTTGRDVTLPHPSGAAFGR